MTGPHKPALRVLTLSTLFPDVTRPQLAPFIVRQTRGLAALPDVQVKVVAPRGLPPWPLSCHPHYNARRHLPVYETWDGLDVVRPIFRHWPAMGGRFDAAALARDLHPVLREIRRSFPFDVIDAQFFFPDGPAAVALGKAFNVPVSIKARGADIHYWGNRPAIAADIRSAGQAADGMLAVSEALREDMIGLGMPGDKIRLHHTGVDLEQFPLEDKAVARAQLGVAGPLIVAVGALIDRKRQSLLLDALVQIPSATLVLIGDGPDRRALERKAQLTGLGDQVRLTGSLSQATIARWLCAADVMALPSRSEGLANAWLESLACGTPIVITDAGGAAEVVQSPAAGYITTPEPEALARAITDIIENPRDRTACRAIAARFSWTRNAQVLRDHLLFLAGK